MINEESISFPKLCDVVHKDGKVQKGHFGGPHEGTDPMTCRGTLMAVSKVDSRRDRPISSSN